MVNPAGAGYTVLWKFDTAADCGSGGLTLASRDGNFYGTVPPGATTGKVEVVTPNGSAKSGKTFTIN
jgi:hypothetical protein